MTELSQNDVLPQVFYRHVEKRPDALYLTQPIGDDKVDTYSYLRVLDEAKRMAAHLRAMNLPAQSKIAIISKNCAEFFITDLAIWMAGHVSVALYPTLTAGTVQYILEHSEAKLLFVGKLDTWAELKKGVPEGLSCVAFPLAPKTEHPSWDSITSKHEPIEGRIKLVAPVCRNSVEGPWATPLVCML